jgi:hypothetical protein
LQDALKAVGFEATVLHDFAGSYGYWPIDIATLKTGVEIYFDSDLSELKELYPVLAAALDGRDRGVTFTSHGDSAELGVSLALVAAISHLSGAVMYEPIEGVIHLPSRAVAEAREFFAEASSRGYNERQEWEQKENFLLISWGANLKFAPWNGLRFPSASGT